MGEEEEELPGVVKSAGPPPHMDRENAWKQSWKALEDMYMSENFDIESIGVSNFQLNDMKQFELFARIQPHIIQLNVWSILYDPELIIYCQAHNILIQVYNVMNLLSGGSAHAPNARYHVEKVADDLSKKSSTKFTVAQVIQAWLIQHGISVIPRTSSFDRLHENSSISLSSIPELSKEQTETVAHSGEAFLSRQDLEDF